RRGVRHCGNGCLVQLHSSPTTPRRERLVACNREQPRRDRRARLERGSLPPHVEKQFTQEVLGQGPVVYEAQQPPIQRHPIPCEEHSHSRLVACGDPSDERLIGRTFASRCPFKRCGGRFSTDANRSQRRPPLHPRASTPRNEVTIPLSITWLGGCGRFLGRGICLLPCCFLGPEPGRPPTPAASSRGPVLGLGL